ncbi:membrane protein, partial [Candidatus Magnetomorum sp. HK-1]
FIVFHSRTKFIKFESNIKLFFQLELLGNILMKKFIHYTNFITITIISFFISISASISRDSIENNTNKSIIPVQFYGEKVNITLNYKEITVDGLYYFRNLNKACQIMILYPFPIDLSYSYLYCFAEIFYL